MTIQEKLTESLFQVKVWYGHVFDYALYIKDMPDLRRCQGAINRLYNAGLFETINAAKLDNTVNFTHLILELTNILTEFKEKYHAFLIRKSEVWENERGESYFEQSVYFEIENHYIKLESVITELEEMLTIGDGSTKTIGKKGNIKCSLSDDQLESLYQQLKSVQYISNSTELISFKGIFDLDSEENVTPIIWILTSSKNRKIANKRALVELFLILKDKTFFEYSSNSVLFKFIGQNFIDTNGIHIKPTAANKPTDDSPSEVRLDLEKIIDFL